MGKLVQCKNGHERNRLTKEEQDNLINDLRNRNETGIQVSDLAAKYGIRENTVYNYISRTGTSLKNKPQLKLSDEQKQTIYKQFKSGVTAAELAKNFGININTVYKLVKKLGKSNEQIESTNKFIEEQFVSELSGVVDNTFIDNIDRSLLSEYSIKLLDDMEIKRKELFEKYKEYSIELIKYVTDANTVSEMVKTEMEEKYRYLQSKFERRIS